MRRRHVAPFISQRSLVMTPLRLRMIEDMRTRNLSQRTQATYVEQVARFARHFGKSPELLGPAEIRSWRLHLAENKRLAASSISVTDHQIEHPSARHDLRQALPHQQALHAGQRLS